MWRNVRSPQEGENIEIAIVSIICLKAKERGRQYTKRLLPPFVIPFCQIGREGVLQYLRRFPDGRIVYRIAAEMLGAQDLRTIRRHLDMARGQIAKAALKLAPLLREVPAHVVRPRRPGESDSEYLEDLAQQAHRAGRRAGGGRGPRIPSLVYVHLVSVFARASRPLATPLTCVVRAIVFYDTS